jgi:hypothetical protein
MHMHRDIDLVIARLRRAFPALAVEQLRMPHPGDDDGIWFFTYPGVDDEVQLESPNGQAPFLVESNRAPATEAMTPDEAEALVIARLGLDAGTA